MNAELQAVAEKCLRGSETNAMTFPAIVKMLIDNGFEGYTVDYRRGTATYFLADGDSVELAFADKHGPVALAFNATAINAAVREAQQLIPGYTYKSFCAKATAAGCAGYLVSFPGKRVLYFGRTAETHVEHFPQ